MGTTLNSSTLFVPAKIGACDAVIGEVKLPPRLVWGLDLVTKRFNISEFERISPGK